MGDDEDDAPELLLMAVVEWDDDDEDGPNDNEGDGEDQIGELRGTRPPRIQKIRVTSNDARKLPAVTWQDLRAVLLREQRQRRRPAENESASNQAGCSEHASFVVRAYDASLRDWVVLNDDLSSHNHSLRGCQDAAAKEDDLVIRFGRRVRVVVSFRPQESPSVRLALQGRYLASEWLDAQRIVVNGGVLRIRQQPNRPDTACCVWDGATLLARFLERNSAAREWICHRRVLELGAGCGLAGIAAGALGAASVVLTDLASHLPLLVQNVAENASVWKSKGCKRMVCCECDWTSPPLRLVTHDGVPAENDFDVLLVADCVWMEHLVDPLLKTIDQFVTNASTACDGGGRVLFSYQRRGKGADDRFWKGLRERFGFIEILSDGGTLGQPDVLKLICARKGAAKEDT